jgi:hypothetical protein
MINRKTCVAKIKQNWPIVYNQTQQREKHQKQKEKGDA